MNGDGCWRNKDGSEHTPEVGVSMEDALQLNAEYDSGYMRGVEDARPVVYLARDALRAVALNAVIMGMSARVRDYARQHKRADPLVLLQSAHAHCCEWAARHGG